MCWLLASRKGTSAVSICWLGIGARAHALRQKHGPGWLSMDLGLGAKAAELEV